MPQETTRILQIDANDSEAKRTLELLREASAAWFELTRVSRLSDALRKLVEEQYDIVLMDLNLPDSRGLKTLIQVREMAMTIPIVVLNSREDEGLQAQSIREGAQDHLVKGWQGGKSDTLLRSIRYAMELKRTEEQLRRLSRYDSLTNLANRTVLYDRLELALSLARRYKRTLAVLALDLDHFKRINDTLGHAVGDKLLKLVAERLTTSLRANDTIARLGGDEFAVLLAEVRHAEDIAEIVGKMMTHLNAPFHIDGHEVFVSASVGSSIYPTDGDDPETLLKNADSALLRAKEIGRNNHQFYSPVMNEKAAQRLQMANGLRRALERQQFLLHFQPQIDLKSGTIVGIEALLRWKHPDWGLIPPGDFIPLSEETGLIIPIGEWVLRTACQQAREWQEAGLPAVSIAVNISSRQFSQKNLAEMVVQVLDETGLDPQYLVLELTESVFMHNEEGAIATLRTLKETGVRISIDDFGTGYSSLRYLKRFPIDELKIDQSFVRDITTESNDAAIVQAVIAMANGLQLKVVAEGVETPEQLVCLKKLGCHLMQGYYLSRPLPREEMTRLFNEGSRWETPTSSSGRSGS